MIRVGLINLVIMMVVSNFSWAQELQCNLNEERITAAMRVLEERLPGESNITAFSIQGSENVGCRKLQQLASRVLTEPVQYCRAAVKFFNRVDASRLPGRSISGKCQGTVSVSGEVNGEPFELSKRLFGKWGAAN